MKKLIFTNLIITTFLVLTSMTNVSGQSKHKFSGEDLFEARCTVCHITTKPTPEQRKYIIAPPIMGVMHHIKGGIKIEEGEDEKEKIIAFIVDYVHYPSAEKSYCDKDAIKSFGVMPSLRATVSVEELKLIAEYLYENFPPKHFDHDKFMQDE